MYTTESLFRCLHDKTKTLHLAFMLCAALHDIDTGRIDAGMAKKVGQLCYILFQLIEGNGEQMPEVMRKDFPWLYMGGSAKFPHLLPNVGPIHGFAVFCDENRAAGNTRFLTIGPQRSS